MNEVIQRILQDIDLNREYSGNVICKDDYKLEAKLMADEINYCDSSNDVEQVISRIFARKYGQGFDRKNTLYTAMTAKIFTLAK